MALKAKSNPVGETLNKKDKQIGVPNGALSAKDRAVGVLNGALIVQNKADWR